MIKEFQIKSLIKGGNVNKGGSVLRAASRRVNSDALKPNRESQVEPSPVQAPASMSRLGGSSLMKPPSTVSTPTAGTPSAGTPNEPAASIPNNMTTPTTTLGNGNTSVNGSAFSVSTFLLIYIISFCFCIVR